MTKHDDDRRWERGWEEHSTAQLVRLAQLPLADKLQWLEETARVVRHLAAAADSGKPA